MHVKYAKNEFSSVGDTKTILYCHLRKLKLCLPFVGILFRCDEEENIFIPELFFFLFTPPFNFLFLSVIHQNTGNLSGYGIMFMHISQKSDSKKSFGILRTSEYYATSINCS